MSKKVILFTLQTFSSTGGIQKMTRTLGHSLYQLSQNINWNFELWSAYDKPDDLMPQYLPASAFKGFGVNRVGFVLKAISRSVKPDIIILSHINLAVIGLFIKLVNPKCKVWVIAHGIEVWRPLSLVKEYLLKRCDKVVCVSNFTRGQMIVRHNLNPAICDVLNNAIDPFMKLPANFQKPKYLLARYKLNPTQPVIFTLTRLASTEQYKGYEHVIRAVSKIKSSYPDIKYILAGKYDNEEEDRINKLIVQHDVASQVILTGFIEEPELSDHFLLADMFVLPSKKEGFGIVFIEALACGLPVICGNADGSIDAIRNGELGKAINTDDPAQLYKCITEFLESPLTPAKRENLQKKCLMYFNETDYMNKLHLLLNE
ncbi:glycosyltransferase family 4 protein [Mucilaginibacter ginsenosidivorax]|uniref:Glycosyltransferase family 4 protein n=1 Tax=Mucilaginibacter ginsenosidivorax TaxID=862126 RepID=A0A5B8W254_9SPHI|nr:glycosyltransferase family 4 protein [Mucilaginibacter ginsenosidivorax]QEC77934.1 glycosyltransferase family 4 protein [Mucilaginibacter ginsenosidivorax]